ncbi:hypothetical protein AVEN_144591-1 [Araneus ventricosus]|uniref:Uncharacterized protein n=1 Tax=Araneus ventricosus TaxID=182803 RepID=A0A4Y2C1A0_ARAVE|nr:hypothetical protein AVEN_144591-1 [Araneus ventricosus]
MTAAAIARVLRPESALPSPATAQPFPMEVCFIIGGGISIPTIIVLPEKGEPFTYPAASHTRTRGVLPEMDNIGESKHPISKYFEEIVIEYHN